MDIVVAGGGPWSESTNFPTHHTARLLARDHRVLYFHRDSHLSLTGQLMGRLEGFHSAGDLARQVLYRHCVRQVQQNLWVSALSGGAVLLPLSYPPPARRVAAFLVVRQLRAALNELGFARPILWIYWWFFPELVTQIPHRLAVYDIYDDHTEYDFVRSSRRRKSYTRATEEKLLKAVDLAFAVSRTLEQEKRGGAPVHYLPNGVDTTVVRNAAKAGIPDDLRKIPRPIIGYLGSFDSRLDWELVEDLCRLSPSLSFVFIGGGYTAPRAFHPNLYLMGNRDYPVAMRYVNHFDVGLIPFVQDALTAAVCPAKLFDYLATGCPIVSTPIPAVAELAEKPGLVYCGRDATEFRAAIDTALTEDIELREQRIRLAGSLTWERRAERAMEFLQAALAASETQS